MKSKCSRRILFVFAVLVFGGVGLVHSQEAAPHGKVEARINVLSLPLQNFNLGLRLNTVGRFKPDLYLSVQLPLLQSKSLRGDNMFVGLLGDCFSGYVGFTYFKDDWRQRSMRWSFQMGMKAYHTGRFSWSDGGSDYAMCGESDQMRLSIGPRVVASKLIPLTAHFGLEFFGGAGFRIGAQKDKIFHQGEHISGCSPTFPPTYPVGVWLDPHLVFVPTLHGGISVVVW